MIKIYLMRYTILILLLTTLLKLAQSEPTTLTSGGGHVVEFELTHSNRTGEVEYIKYQLFHTFPSYNTPLDGDNYFSQVCLDTNSADYSIPTSTNSLKAWAFEWQCNANCDTIEDVGDASIGYALYYTDEAAYDATTGRFSYPAMAMSGIPGTAKWYTPGSTQIEMTSSLMGPADMETYNFPTLTEPAYYRCWAVANAGTISLTNNGVSDLQAVYTTSSNNVTLAITPFTEGDDSGDGTGDDSGTDTGTDSGADTSAGTNTDNGTGSGTSVNISVEVQASHSKSTSLLLPLSMVLYLTLTLI